MKKTLFTLFFGASLFAACNQTEVGASGANISDPNDKDLTGIPSSPHYFVVPVPQGFPAVEHPIDNPISHEGVALGRYLFYDVRLSKGDKLSCGSCHLAKDAFSDPNKFSTGVDGLQTNRQSMAIMNLGLKQVTFFWDGRANSLEEQALQPVENHIELNENWTNVIAKLRTDTMYHRLFRQAFSIRKVSEITKELAAKAIAQFERTIIVGGDSRYYKVFVKNQGFPTDDESLGYNLFFNVPPYNDAQCFHCHSGALPHEVPLLKSGTGDLQFTNNGLDYHASLDDYIDKGRGAITGNRNDNGKFKAPPLWNIGYSAPYMHDGRFSSLKKVVDFYSNDIKLSDNVDPFVTQIHLDTDEKRAILVFLDMLSDTTSLRKPEYSNPFIH